MDANPLTQRTAELTQIENPIDVADYGHRYPGSKTIIESCVPEKMVDAGELANYKDCTNEMFNASRNARRSWGVKNDTAPEEQSARKRLN